MKLILLTQVLYLSLAFNEVGQVKKYIIKQTIDNPIKEYVKVGCREIDECFRCSFAQMNTERFCQITGSIIAMTCQYEIEHTIIKYDKIEYKPCMSPIFTQELFTIIIIFGSTALSLYTLQRMRSEQSVKVK